MANKRRIHLLVVLDDDTSMTWHFSDMDAALRQLNEQHAAHKSWPKRVPAIRSATIAGL